MKDTSPWVIIPVHNRKEMTTQCLEHLKETQDWEEFNVLVVDDGSTDETRETVIAEFPDVDVVVGDGSLWWGGSVRLGMEYAKERGADVFVWLNNDVLPEEGGVMELVSKVSARGDTVLTTRVRKDVDEEYTTGNRKTRFGLKRIIYDPDREIQFCDALAGKFTGIPRRVVDEIGFPDDETYPHLNCDYDYTFRAKENGFEVGVYNEVTARDVGSDDDPQRGSRLSPRISLEDVFWCTFSSDRHTWYTLRTRFYQYRRFYGPPQALAYACFAYVLLRSIVAIVVKFALAVSQSDQTLRSSQRT